MKTFALANSFALVSFLGFLICIVWATINQATFIAFWNSWMHGFNLELLVPAEGLKLNLVETLLGIASFTISGWFSGYLLAWFYNKFSGQ